MKKLVLSAVVAAALLTACSKDDEKKCESCTSDLGNKFEICDNGNGTYDATSNGVTQTITEAELEGFTPKQVVELSCQFDTGPNL
ncbi:hypothetical protein [Flagellimonas lutimaris]|jgi:major membrane immunogen (membrane-anchored lipoprotein)|uniref:hypothetical protein n=1 Tax=Flagellimonas TaxID=444459 RepID=UPI000B6CFAE0|nr:MAG: hypothetical protein CBB72_008065 [Muricauda sp. TMED12]|tara:strand:+ start:1612 stop:1866 length:255 start_codon:yes stop_codon:yes gene_type:complete